MMSDSMPPNTKNARAVTRYFIPIRLWSTVVNHEMSPGGSYQLCSSSSRGTVVTVAIWGPLPE
jgi:hypothetical protein